MQHLMVYSAIAAVAAVIVMIAAGFRPIVPVGFVLQLALLFPAAWALREAVGFLEQRLRSAPRSLPIFGFSVALFLVWLYYAPADVTLFFIVFTLVMVRPGRPSAAVLRAAAVVVCGYAALWAVNYPALWAGRDRIADAAVRLSDQRLYGWFVGHPIDYRGWFPLTDNPVVISALAASYMMFFVELVAVLFVLQHDAQSLANYLIGLFSCYAVGLTIFIVWPVAGPYLAYPESVRSAIDRTVVGAVMHNSQAEYSAILRGLQPITAFGYFVGLPSLHAAMAVLCQMALRNSRLMFWTFLPLNLLMAISTVILGFHYIADTITGLLLGWSMVRLLGIGNSPSLTHTIRCADHLGRDPRTVG